MQLSDLLSQEVINKMTDESAKNLSDDERKEYDEMKETGFRNTNEMLAYLQKGGSIVPKTGFDREGFFMEGDRIRERFMVISDAGIPICYDNNFYTEDDFIHSEKFGAVYNGFIMCWKKGGK